MSKEEGLRLELKISLPPRIFEWPHRLHLEEPNQTFDYDSEGERRSLASCQLPLHYTIR